MKVEYRARNPGDEADAGENVDAPFIKDIAIVKEIYPRLETAKGVVSRVGRFVTGIELFVDGGDRGRADWKRH